MQKFVLSHLHNLNDFMSENIWEKVGIVVLAAGKGKRMLSKQLKVMHNLKGKPLIDYIVSAVESLGLPNKPVIVVCTDNPSVQEYLGDRAEYVTQKEMLGTGHAVMMAEDFFKGQVKHVVTLNGDMPLITGKSIKQLVEKHLERNNKLTLMTAIVPDFSDWRISFYDYGRVIRGGEKNYITKIIEKKDATAEQLEIKELNTSLFCFRTDWLWKNLHQLKNNNAQEEYYLTDLVEQAFAEGEKLSSVNIDPKEAMGINTIEQLKIVESIN